MFDNLKKAYTDMLRAALTYVEDYKLNEDAEISAGSVIGLAIAIIVIAAVMPAAIGTFYSTNTTGWTINGAEDTKATTLWWLLPFICVAVVLYMIYKRLN